MKKTSLIIASVFILLTAGAAGYLALQKDEQPADNSQQTSTPSGLSATNAGQQTPAVATPAPSGYVEYDDEVVTNTAGKKVLFFYAPWCSQCRSIEAGIIEQGVPAGLTIIKVDYDSHQSLRQKYGVKLQTTFVKIDDSGNKTDLYVAYEEPTFDSVKRNFLNL